MKRAPIPILIALSFCAALIGCQSAFSRGSGDFIVGSKDIVGNSSEDGFIDCGRYGLLNDMRGSGGSLQYSQSVYRDKRTGAMGWEWNTGRLRTRRGNVMGYPCLYYGKSPFRALSTTPDMPAGVTDFNKRVTFDFRLEAEGSYSTAFVLYIVSDPNPNPKDVLLEMSIWVDHVDFESPAPQPLKKFSSDGHNFRLESKRDSAASGSTGRSLARFISDKPLHSATLSLGNFVRFLAREGLVPPGCYVASIEFGNEIIAGKGTMTVKKYLIK
jgi:hypothetical protein